MFNDHSKPAYQLRTYLSIQCVGAVIVAWLLSGLFFELNVFAQTGGFANPTGGQGGEVVRTTTGTEIHEALCSRAGRDTPIIIEVEGTINHGNTSQVSGDSCSTTADKIELKNVDNITLIGVDDGALFDELGIHVHNANNIIIRNVHVRNVKKSGSPTSNGGDAIGMDTDVDNVWIDHVTLEASGGEDEGYDGLLDIKANTTNVVLSYSILRNSGRGGLVGSSESDTGNGFVTWHHNIIEEINSRTPLFRGGIGHFYNNWYNGIYGSAINSRAGAQAKIENNLFENVKNPIGTFYTNERGTWEVSGNRFGNNITWSSAGDKSYPAGPNPTSTTSITIPYAYTLDDPACLPALLSEIAGANSGLRTSDDACYTNLSLLTIADTDGSSKAAGTSYDNAQDDDINTYWQPAEAPSRISIKWSADQTVGSINIVEAAGFEGNIESWQLVNHDTGDVITTGNGAGVISFTPVTLSKINFEVLSATGMIAVAEFQTYVTEPPIPLAVGTVSGESRPPLTVLMTLVTVFLVISLSIHTFQMQNRHSFY